MDLGDHAVSTKPAVILHPSGATVSFGGFEAHANRLAHYLCRQGLVAEDTIAVVMENNEHIHAVIWAARRSGLTTSDRYATTSWPGGSEVGLLITSVRDRCFSNRDCRAVTPGSLYKQVLINKYSGR